MSGQTASRSLIARYAEHAEPSCIDVADLEAPVGITSYSGFSSGFPADPSPRRPRTQRVRARIAPTAVGVLARANSALVDGPRAARRARPRSRCARARGLPL